MHNYDNLCMNCMREIIDPAMQCPHCGFHNDSPQLAPYLQMRTLVANRYLVGKLLEYNGDGATYMAWDIERKAPVTIREFLPDAIATRKEDSTEIEVTPGYDVSFRDCLQSFLDLWRKLARMRGLSALILVIDIVEDNGTAYAISEYMESITLREYLLASKTGYLSWPETRTLFMPVLSTLATLHSAGIIHRGISPTTLIIGKDKKMRISGFSIWQARASWGDLNFQLFAGYAAIEQYGFEGQQGSWTDIYAFAAVLYRTLIGSTPLEATTRVTNDKMMVPGKFAEQLPAYVINALINALQILPEDRTRTVEQFRAELSASPTVTVNGAEYMESHTNPITSRRAEPIKPKPNQPHKNTNKKPNKKTSLSVGIRAALIVLSIGLIIFAILFSTIFRDHIVSNGEENNIVSVSTETMVEVPNFVNRTYSIVSNERAYKTNFVLKKEEQYSSTVKTGYIISQNVDPGKQVLIGTQIELVVSLGIEQIQFIDVLGKNYEEASQELTNIGFKCNKINKINTGDHNSNTIAAVNLIVGEKYDKDTTVVLQVWTDNATTTSQPAE
ncbi:MAG: PASTA domain-containing protein [Clostridia bacterium]|nr:PASTA domain-containing protein [Clostridia bacterium]